MKILIVNNAVPFVWGGAEELAKNLAVQLNLRDGIQAEVMRIPFEWQPKERVLDEILMNRLFRFSNVDRVIALKFPAYLVEHDHKTIWLLHQYRQAYELASTEHSPFHIPEDEKLIEAVRAADNACFADARATFVNSGVTQDRLKRFNHFDAEVLHPPVNDPELFFDQGDDEYLFAGGRITRGKRQHLIIEGVKQASNNCRVVIAGPTDDEDYVEMLRTLIARYDLEDRVDLRVGLLDRKTIAGLIAKARAGIYIPYDEDSFGYVTMEAFSCAKPIVSTSDAGGILHLVQHEETGLVVEPDSIALGAAFDRLMNDQRLSRELGANAFRLLTAKRLTWSATLDKLLE